MIKTHTIYFDRRMRYNKVKYITATVIYCTRHDSRVTFCMPEFSIGKIINNNFHINNEKGESGIGYVMIIVLDLMVEIFMTDSFKHQVHQQDGATVHMKEYRGLLGKFNITKSKIH